MKQEMPMNAIDTLDYIAACELAEYPAPLAAFMASRNDASRLVGDLTDAAEEDAVAKGAVVEGSLVAFAEGVSRQSKEDVMDSFLFATLVANKQFSPDAQGAEWYNKFNEVLSKIGWLSTQWSYARYRGTQARFTMDEVGLEVLGSAVTAAALPGPASLLMLKVARDTIEALKAKQEPLRIFERQTKTHSGGSFRIASCVESEDETLNLAMAAVSFKTGSDVTNVLFWEWQDTEVETWKGEDNLVLNTGLYSLHRELIRQRLSNNAKSAIEEFEI